MQTALLSVQQLMVEALQIVVVQALQLVVLLLVAVALQQVVLLLVVEVLQQVVLLLVVGVLQVKEFCSKVLMRQVGRTRERVFSKETQFKKTSTTELVWEAWFLLRVAR
jgi:hypothetical protein